MNSKRTFFTFLFLILFVSFAFAIPQSFNIHGRLTNSAGAPQEDTYNMTFTIYSDYAGTTPVWATVESVTTDSNGVYSVILSGINNLTFENQYFLGIKVATDPEMTPLLNLTSSPSAFRAQNVSVGGVEFDSNVNLTTQNLWTMGNVTASFFFGDGSGLINLNLSGIDLSGLNGSSQWLNGSGGAIYYNGGNVGIGVTNPTYKLSISGGDAYIIGNTDTRFIVGDSLSTDDFGQLQWDTSGNYLSLETSGTSRPLILQQDGGNVGIGTTSPGGKLSIKNIAASPTGTDGIWTTFQDSSGTNQWGFSEYSAGDFNIYEAGVADGRLYLKAGGNVGIGTISPGAKLEVNGSILLSSLTDSISINNAYVKFYRENSQAVLRGYYGFKAEYYNGSSYVPGIYLNNGGNVGIGTTTPQNKLNVIGDGNFTGTLYVNGNDEVLTEANLNVSGVNYWTQDGTNLTYTDGNVGIGTASPGALLDINSATQGPIGLIVGWSSFNNLEVGTSTAWTRFKIASGDTNIHFYSKGSGSSAVERFNISGGTDIAKVSIMDSNFTVNTNQLFVEQSSGNVGIGTASPDALLHVYSSNGGRDPHSASLIAIESAGQAQIEIIAGASSESGIWFSDNGGAGRGTILYHHADDSLRFETASTERLRIDSSGNVGIGTTTPQNTLNVIGDGNFTGTLYVNGNDEVLTEANLNVSGVNYWTQDGTNLTYTDGNVGIGTASPYSKLTIQGDAGDNVVSALYTGDGDGGDYAYQSIYGVGTPGSITDRERMLIGWDGSSEYRINIDRNGAGVSRPLNIYTYGNSNQLYLDTDGNVGIGTASPTKQLELSNSTGAELSLNSKATSIGNGDDLGTIYFTGSDSDVTSGSVGAYIRGEASGTWGADNDYPTEIQFWTSPNDGVPIQRMVVMDMGYVGIGTTSPSTPLHVNSSSSVQLRLERTTAGSQAAMELKNGDGYTSTIGYGGDERFYISTSSTSNALNILNGGNVGIGTTTPGEALDVVGNINATGDVCLDDGTCLSTVASAGSGYVPYTGATANVDLGANNLTVDTNLLHVDATNNRIGIGTASPTNRLQIEGTSAESATIGIKNTYSGGANAFITATADNWGAGGGLLAFGQGTPGSGTIDMVLDSSGNVGIGTTDPDYKLTVNGAGPLASFSSSSYAELVLNSTSSDSIINFKDAGTQTAKIGYDVSDSAFKIIGGASAFSANHFVVTSSGNVGIGTASPSVQLEVNSGSDNDALLLESTDASVTFSMKDSATSGTNSEWVITKTGNDVRFYAGALERMRLVGATGNVGIRTSSPDTELHVGLATSDTAGVSGLKLARATDSTLAFNLRLDATNKDFHIDRQDDSDNWYSSLTIDRNTGYIGIGTTSPDDKLDVAGSISIPYGYQFKMYNSAGTGWGQMSYDEGTNLVEFNRGIGGSAETFKLSNDNTVSWINSGGGNVGIGTSSPSYRLDVNGTMNAYDVLINGSSVSSITSSQWTTTGSDIYYDTGKIGIGTTSPSSALHVVGDINATGSMYAGSTYYYGDGTTAKLRLSDSSGSFLKYGDGTYYGAGSNVLTAFTSSTERMRIDSSGNVGIGTTSPSSMLDVNGTITAGTTYVTKIDGTGGGSFLYFGTRADSDALGTISAAGGAFNIDSSNGDMIFKQETIEKMRMTTEGYIGIGTNDPTKKLVVNGTYGGLVVDTENSDTTNPTINTTSGNVTITSAGGSVIIRLG